MKGLISGIVGAMFIFWGCAPVEEKPLVISVDTWIGASPLYYAHATGWLKEANIQILQAGSIEENLNLYETNASDVVTGTEHEYFRLKEFHKDLIPVIIYDRSYGGDVILSNRTLQQLLQPDTKMSVYVELDTVGEDMLNYLIVEHNLSKDKMKIYNRSQEEIKRVGNPNSNEAFIMITYNPHDLALKKQGFKEIASSKNDHYVVVDSFMTSRQVYNQHKKQLQTLKALMDKAVSSYQNNPKLFYKTVKPYLNNVGFEEFEQMRANIRWINNETLSPVMKKKLEEMNYPVAELIYFNEVRR
ncbi:MAG: hypothetical protein Q8N01_02845 [Sulfuricurvum sp.]|nr:hypothetical protein [Sulfuricurvum sp.]